jgi:1-deoxy-D-xylulose-5-phosphate synthase
VVAGGAGSAVAECLAANDVAMPMLHLGLPDAFIDHGDPAFLLAHVGLDAQGILRSIEARFGGARGRAVKPAA